MCLLRVEGCGAIVGISTPRSRVAPIDPRWGTSFLFKGSYFPESELLEAISEKILSLAFGFPGALFLRPAHYIVKIGKLPELFRGFQLDNLELF